MQKTAAALIVVLSCSSINFTFPLHRDAAKFYVLFNNTEKCDKTPDRMTNIVDRTKKMASNIENALKKILVIDTAQDNNIKKDTGRCSHAKQGLVGSDLSNYEQLVIMKKYPFLDLEELDHYHPMPHENTGQSFHSGPMLDHESNFCESSNKDEINVDITNRGLTGFAIPSKLKKKGVRSSTLTSQTAYEKKRKSVDSVAIHDLIKELEQDITKFVLK